MQAVLLVALLVSKMKWPACLRRNSLLLVTPHSALLPLTRHLQGKVYTINTNPAVGYWASGNKFSHLNYTEVG